MASMARWAKWRARSRVAATVSCGLPRSGPNRSEILSGSTEKQGNSFIVPVDARVARLTAVQNSTGFPASFRQAGIVGSDDVRPGDLLAVAATGAYCYAMSSRYNLIGRPAVVAVRDGHARLILRRETVDDLLSLEVR